MTEKQDRSAADKRSNLPPLNVGLTGNIGSGKSTVASLFSELGVPTFDADKVGHELLDLDTRIQSRIVETFGKEIVLDGVISRSKLGKIVFGNPAKKAKLEGILHPAIMNTMAERALESNDSRYVVMEVPLLYEAKLADNFDYVILVKANKKNAVERAARSLGINREEVLKRLATQIPQSDKEKLADFVISNDGSLVELKERVKLLHVVISSLSQQTTEND